MIRYLFTIFLPLYSFKRMLPIMGVLITLSTGIGVFWMIQSLMENYFDEVTRMALISKEEITIIRNPSKKYMTEEEIEEEYFSGVQTDIQDRTTISMEKYDEIRRLLDKLKGQIKIQGLCRVPDADFISIREGIEYHYKPLLIATDITADCRVLPILDSLTPQEITDFMKSNEEAIPFLASESLFPSLQKGDTLTLTFNGKPNPYKCVGILQNEELFAIPLLVISIPSRERLMGTVKFDAVAIRTEDYRSTKLVGELKNCLGDEFIVSHWSEMLKILNGVFNSINLIITLIVSSLFVMAFFFAITTFDIMIKKRRRHLAMFLAMGMPPGQIRNGLICVSGVIGIIGIGVGMLFARWFLFLIPFTPLKAVFSQMFIRDFTLRFDSHILLLIVAMTFAVTVFSAMLSARRIFKMDPVQDLRK
ncbi:MAG: FtsX-like permease family protein [Planctomycetia bacterium]|nr:FtsX-like permease family protein [Planctomycetia bacterium]